MGILLSALTLNGLFVTRILGRILYGSSNVSLWILAGVEFVGASVNCITLRAVKGHTVN